MSSNNKMLRKCIFQSIAVILYLCVKSSAQDQLVSPCPNIFQYRYDGSQWYGMVEIPSPPLGQTVKINVMLSLRAQLPTQYVGMLELFGSREAAIQEIKYRRPIQYRIRFPLSSPIPKITQILYNNQVLCNGPAESGNFVTAIRLEHTLFTELGGSTPYYPQTPVTTLPPNQPSFPPGEAFTTRPQTTTLPPYIPPPTQAQQSDNVECGKLHNRFQISPLIVGGATIERGSWPWLAAIYISKATGLSFNCGGNLVSHRVVVSAAHCFKTSVRQYAASEVIIFLGRYNILKWSEEGSAVTEAESIIVNSDYMKRSDTSYDADVAVVILKNRVQYNEYIRPICLWEGSDNINEIVGTSGTVVGWGRDGNGNIVTPEPHKISIPIVSGEVCLWSSDTYRYITSNRTFCAGRRDGFGPCNGDSGSGMAIFKNNKIMLRGIVSAALADPVMNTCNLGEYVVFTDAAKFVNWIKSYMNL